MKCRLEGRENSSRSDGKRSGHWSRSFATGALERTALADACDIFGRHGHLPAKARVDADVFDLRAVFRITMKCLRNTGFLCWFHLVVFFRPDRVGLHDKRFAVRIERIGHESSPRVAGQRDDFGQWYLRITSITSCLCEEGQYTFVAGCGEYAQHLIGQRQNEKDKTL